MNGKAMDERVTNLEKLAESLAPLPERMRAVESRLGTVETRLSIVETRLTTVESQILQHRTETRVGFSTVRREMRMLHEEVIRRIALRGNRRLCPCRRSLLHSVP